MGRIRPLQQLTVTHDDGRPLLTADYTRQGGDHTVVATVIDNADPDRRRRRHDSCARSWRSCLHSAPR